MVREQSESDPIQSAVFHATVRSHLQEGTGQTLRLGAVQSRQQRWPQGTITMGCFVRAEQTYGEGGRVRLHKQCVAG